MGCSKRLSQGPISQTLCLQCFARLRTEISWDYVLERWRRPQHFLDQLELPGDMWNINFYGKIYPRYIEPLMPKSKKKVEAAKAIRILYDDVLNKEANERGLYPEQFDVTFDLAPNCGSQLCHICPLGRNNSSNLCIGDLRKTQSKYCPLLASFCNYFVRCKTKDCPVLGKKSTRTVPTTFQGMNFPRARVWRPKEL